MWQMVFRETVSLISSLYNVADEITAARGGIPRGSDIPSWTDKNSIDLKIDGEDFFGSLYGEIVAAQKGDFIHANLFAENGDLMLDPSAKPDPKSTSLLKVLQGLIETMLFPCFILLVS